MERGLVDPQAVRDALEMGQRGSLPFPEALVSASLVADWELSRTVCEVFGLPFLTVDQAKPDPSILEGMNTEFLRENGLVPLARCGQILTVAMPAIVPAEILGCLAAETDANVLPVVGTVRTNRRWLDENLDASALGSPLAALPTQNIAEGGDEDAEEGWSDFFDEADAAVQLDLTEPLPPAIDGGAE